MILSYIFCLFFQKAFWCQWEKKTSSEARYGLVRGFINCLMKKQKRSVAFFLCSLLCTLLLSLWYLIKPYFKILQMWRRQTKAGRLVGFVEACVSRLYICKIIVLNIYLLSYYIYKFINNCRAEKQIHLSAFAACIHRLLNVKKYRWYV